MRKLLFSKSFFALLAFVLVLDMTADILEHVNPRHYELLNLISLLFDAVALLLALWMFFDLARRRPTNGGHSHSG